MIYPTAFSVLVAIFCSTSLLAAEKGKDTADYVLKIGTMDLIPYGWKDNNNHKHGIIYELNDEIGQRLGIPFSNNIYPFKRMLKMLKSGKLDLVSSQAHQAALESGEQLGIQHNIDVIAGTKKGAGIQTLMDLKGKNLIYHLSASYKELEGFPKSISRTDNYKHSVFKLYNDKEMHAAIFSEPAYYYWMEHLGLSNEDFGQVIIIAPNKSQWVFVRNDLAEGLKKDIKQVVADIYKENMYGDLLLKYGKDDT